MKRSTAEKAARWWANQLRGVPVYDNGVDSAPMRLARSFTMAFRDEEAACRTSDQLAAFEQELAAALLHLKDKRVCFGVDYYPDDLLLEVADTVGIGIYNSLPWKTLMLIENDQIRIACGYGSAWTRLD